MSQVAAGGEAGAGPIEGALPAAPNRDVGGGGPPNTPPPAHPRRKRWPVWSEQGRDQRFTICNICGFSEPLHSTVCPFGPEPTRSKERS